MNDTSFKNLSEYWQAYKHIVDTYGYKRDTTPGRMLLLGWDLEYVSVSGLAVFIDQLLIRRLNDFVPDNDHPLILDCGANIGFSVLNYKRQFPHARIVAFEPDPQFVPLLKRNLERNHAEDVEVVDAAVWIENGEMPWLAEGIDGSRLIMNGDQTTPLRVKTVDLSTYLTQPVDLLKVDIEGAEYRLLAHLEGQLGKVKNIIVECHITQETIGQFGEIMKVLVNEGFHVNINSFGEWRDLIRYKPVNEYFSGEQYVALYGWRTQPPITHLDNTLLPYTGVHYLAQQDNASKKTEQLTEIISRGIRNAGRLRYLQLKHPYAKNGEKGWLVDLPYRLPSGDNLEIPNASSLFLFEDDLLLGPAHMPHDTIRNSGGGQYSHWESQLYFSTSDGSDPNTNGKDYIVVY